MGQWALKKELFMAMGLLVALVTIFLPTECCQDQDKENEQKESTNIPATDVPIGIRIVPPQPLPPLKIPRYKKKKQKQLEIPDCDLIWEKKKVPPPRKKPPKPPEKKAPVSPLEIEGRSPLTDELRDLDIDPEIEDTSRQDSASPIDEWDAQLLAAISRLKQFIFPISPKNNDL